LTLQQTTAGNCRRITKKQLMARRASRKAGFTSLGGTAVPLFSVVIPCYNRGHYITRTLESVLGQQFRDFEIIVVDDGSTDDTPKRLEPFLDRITLLQQPNQGPGLARNLGAQHAVGEYLAFLDSDDLWFPWTLSTFASVIRECNHPAIIAGAITHFSEEAKLSAVSAAPVVYESFSDFFAASRKGYHCSSGQTAVRRSLFVRAGGFANHPYNAEDHDFAMRLGSEPGFAYLTVPFTIAYRQHPGGVTRDLVRTIAGANYLLQMEKRGSYPGGKARRWERRRMLTAHLRPIILSSLREKSYQQAWKLYRETFVWNLAFGRFRFLTGFFLQAASQLLQLRDGGRSDVRQAALANRENVPRAP
jgi:glycosyltransferase involved in cell wall biosynthesis